MRGGTTWANMSFTCVQNNSLAPHHTLPEGIAPFNRPTIMARQSPAPAWNITPDIQVKSEPNDRGDSMCHDSGISAAYTSGSDGFQSSSPGSSDHNSRDSDHPGSFSSSNREASTNQFLNNTPIHGRTAISVNYQHHPLSPLSEMPRGYDPRVPVNYDGQQFQNNGIVDKNIEINSQHARVSPIGRVDIMPPCSTPGEHGLTKSPKEGHRPESRESNDDCGIKMEEGDSLRRLQIAFEHNDGSSKEDGNSVDEDGKSDYDVDELEDENNVRTPRVNSHGRVKTFKCKQCEFVAVTKLDFWEHSKCHIKAEKLLTCPKCPFVTEYKHHLEYHLRNHFGSKPFKCTKCSYSCVNKSMLNSHLKSHSNVYQYRCSDCSYATKYCHSLKLHLRKYGHTPAMVLNPDGTPNPLPIIDVYGTRRGPKQRSSKLDENVNSPSRIPNPNVLPGQHSIFHPQLMTPNPQPGFPIFSLNPMGLPTFNGFAGPLLFPPHNNNNNNEVKDESSLDNSRMSEHYDKSNSPIEYLCCDKCNFTTSQRLDMTDHQLTHHQPKSPIKNANENHEEKSTSTVLDLSSKPEVNVPISIPEVNAPITPTMKNRRKGRAFKLEAAALSLQHERSSDDEDGVINVPKMFKGDNSVCDKMSIDESVNDKEPVKKSLDAAQQTFSCQYCDIVFKDIIMYTMHMGYHGYKDPFTCNMCGEQSTDRVAFFLHIARNSHC